ncbi:MAG: DUF423 domain-containing protein [Porticoccaceae bacterium]|jgi:uncharacterized membrane protein YgdD (TMEM256/DUF423 family)
MSMNKPFWIKIVAINGLLAVLLGAFAAHVLEASLSPERVSVFHTAVKYHMFHTLALLGVICIDNQIGSPQLRTYAAIFFLLGIGLFSGSLYLLVATGITKFAWVTPIGGLALLTGWFLLLISARENKDGN